MNTYTSWLGAALSLFIGTLIFSASPAEAALRPDQLILVVNRASPEGLRIARYYLEKRGVPTQNQIIVETSKGEHIGREEYEKEIAAPVRRFLGANDPRGIRFSCLVMCYGIPLRVGPPRLSLLDEIRVRQLRTQLAGFKEKEAEARPAKEATALKNDIDRVEKEISQISRTREGASVDSEIALVMEEKHPLEGWLPNKYFIRLRGKNIPDMPRKVIPVCRLDGPSEDSVYRIIDDSLYAEAHGLGGRAYFDTRWPVREAKDLSAYQIYDRAIHAAARIVEKSGRIPVVLDERETLFGPGEAPEAGLYCGWYSLAAYVDAFTWVRGSVGFHVASSECTTLKSTDSKVWCKKMLEKGVAATLGPVAEPYLQSFPEPAVFFGLLLEGNTLVESYTVANPFWSWQMVLIGDPLYRPFKPFLGRKLEPGRPKSSSRSD